MRRATKIANERLKRLLNHRKVVRVLAVISFILLGFYLIFKEPISQMTIKSESNQYRIENVSADQMKANAEETVALKRLETVSQAAEVEPSYSDLFLSKFSDKSESLKVTGLVSIPDLSINLPIFNQNSEEAITYGASNVVSSEMGKGNYSLASHHVFDGSDKRLFAPLKYSTVGMKVYVTNKEKIYTYEVTEIFEVDQYAVQVLDPIENETVITLITCVDYEAQYRTIVRGRLIEEQKYNDAAEDVRKSFEAEFNL